MPVTSVTKDPAALTLTVVADFPVPLQRLWEAYLDPRRLERFWGSAECATQFTRHDAAPGGWSHYITTGPHGEVFRGCWQWLSIETQRRIEVLDSVSLTNGDPDPGMPSKRMVFDFAATATGSRVTVTTCFRAAQELAYFLDRGLEQGARSAVGRMDTVLADLRAFSAELPTHAQLLNDTQVRISRLIRGPIAAVWRAHHEAALLQRWLLGPEGWTMPVCEVAQKVGERYRYEWQKGEIRFGFEGVLLEAQAPYRAVTTERPIGIQAEARNELTLTALEAGTLLCLVITYPSKEIRDQALGTGMTSGMETSYQRLETQLLAAA